MGYQVLSGTKKPKMAEGRLVCTNCGQTKIVQTPEGTIPNLDAEWHKCDPSNVHAPSRQVSNEIFRTLSYMAGKPLRIGGISAEDSAYNDIKKRSTKVIP